MASAVDAVGKKFNRWTIVSKLGYPMGLCRCDCGVEKPVNLYNVISGASKSCGCHRLEARVKRNTSHGMSHTRTYAAWCSMWTRCTNPRTRSYDEYAGRTPPDEWLSFANFLNDMGECPDGYSLERVENDLPYSKDNCIWLPTNAQSRNRRTTTLLQYNGTIFTLKELCAHLGLCYSTVIHRVKKQGKTFPEALDVSDITLIKKGNGYA